MQIVKWLRNNKKHKLLLRVENYILTIKSLKENKTEKMYRFHYTNTSLFKNPYHRDIKKIK